MDLVSPDRVLRPEAPPSRIYQCHEVHSNQRHPRHGFILTKPDSAMSARPSWMRVSATRYNVCSKLYYTPQ